MPTPNSTGQLELLFIDTNVWLLLGRGSSMPVLREQSSLLRMTSTVHFELQEQATDPVTGFAAQRVLDSRSWLGRPVSAHGTYDAARKLQVESRDARQLKRMEHGALVANRVVNQTPAHRRQFVVDQQSDQIVGRDVRTDLGEATSIVAAARFGGHLVTEDKGAARDAVEYGVPVANTWNLLCALAAGAPSADLSPYKVAMTKIIDSVGSERQALGLPMPNYELFDRSPAELETNPDLGGLPVLVATERLFTPTFEL